MNKTLQELKSKIQELIPEIMELKSGCEMQSRRLGGAIIKNIYVDKFVDCGGEERIQYLSFELDGSIKEHFDVGLPLSV